MPKIRKRRRQNKWWLCECEHCKWIKWKWLRRQYNTMRCKKNWGKGRTRITIYYKPRARLLLSYTFTLSFSRVHSASLVRSCYVTLHLFAIADFNVYEYVCICKISHIVSGLAWLTRKVLQKCVHLVQRVRTHSRMYACMHRDLCCCCFHAENPECSIAPVSDHIAKRMNAYHAYNTAMCIFVCEIQR